VTVSSSLGVQIAVHDLGGDGTPLLVSHATGFHGRCYEPLAALLAHRFHSLAFDYRGHGDTPRPDGPVDWQRYGDDAEAMATWLAERAGAPIDAFGHSMGGACLLMAAHRRPELFRRLVLFEPIVFPPGGIRPAEEGGLDPEANPMVIGARRRRAVFPSYRAAIDNYSAKPPLNCFTPESLQAYVLHGFRPDAASTAEFGDDAVRLKCEPETEAATFATGSLHDVWDHLPEIRTRTVVLSGRVEPMQPSSIAQLVAERMPDCTYVQLDELNHFGPMADPQTVAAVLLEALGD
jgi:pimeloyl-ACP methyl ester carboxylesterase